MANDGRVFVGDGYCNSRVVEYSAEGVFQGEFEVPAGGEGGPLRNPHSVVLQECAHALYVAEREASRVHRFAMGTRLLEGARRTATPLLHSFFGYCMALHSQAAESLTKMWRPWLVRQKCIIKMVQCT